MKAGWKSSKLGARVGVVLGVSVVVAGTAFWPAVASAGPVPSRAMFGLSPAQVPTEDVLSQLSGVFCTSAANCWAVGDYLSKGATLNQALHWTGKKWTRVPTPNPGGTGMNDFSELISVRCTSATNCWAVGDSQKTGAAELNEALHWTGKKWFLVATPTPAGTLQADTQGLVDVACTSPGDCWAAGAYGTTEDGSSGVTEELFNQVLHWNGTTWSLASVPNPGGTGPNDINLLDAVRCASAKDCWAAGLAGKVSGSLRIRNNMLHWNGKKWSHVFVPAPGLTKKGSFSELDGLSCTSAANCLAVGTYLAATSTSSAKVLNEILRWNGRKWVMASTPEPGGMSKASSNELIGVTCSSASDCWAVGGVGGSIFTESALNQALHWNGKMWSHVSTPNPAGRGGKRSNTLEAVRCVTSANCWAVGDMVNSSGIERNEILHWNGAKWSVHSS